MRQPRRRRLTGEERWLRDKLESPFQREVLELAGWRGWLRFHDYDSRRNNTDSGVDPGLPDTLLVHPIQIRLIFMELKTETGTIREGQSRWADALEAIPGVEVYRDLRPRDIDRIHAILERRPEVGNDAIPPSVIEPAPEMP